MSELNWIELGSVNYLMPQQEQGAPRTDSYQCPPPTDGQMLGFSFLPSNPRYNQYVQQ